MNATAQQATNSTETRTQQHARRQAEYDNARRQARLSAPTIRALHARFSWTDLLPVDELAQLRLYSFCLASTDDPRQGEKRAAAYKAGIDANADAYDSAAVSYQAEFTPQQYARCTPTAEDLAPGMVFASTCGGIYRVLHTLPNDRVCVERVNHPMHDRYVWSATSICNPDCRVISFAS